MHSLHIFSVETHDLLLIIGYLKPAFLNIFLKSASTCFLTLEAISFCNIPYFSCAPHLAQVIVSEALGLLGSRIYRFRKNIRYLLFGPSYRYL